MNKGMIVWVWGLFFWASCSASKIPAFTKTYSQEEVVAALLRHNHEFEWFQGKATAMIRTSRESQTVKVVIRMEKDRAAWFQVKKFEVEAFRMLVTPDVYTILNRLESSYMTGSIENIHEMVGMDISFEDLQNLLFGNIVLPEGDSIHLKQDGEFVIVDFSSGEWQIQYSLDKKHLRIREARIFNGEDKELQVGFDSYKKLANGMMMAHARTIRFPEEPGVQGILRLDFTEMEVNVPKELKFVVPSHYREFE
jgi:hypothetical protein